MGSNDWLMGPSIAYTGIDDLFVLYSKSCFSHTLTHCKRGHSVNHALLCSHHTLMIACDCTQAALAHACSKCALVGACARSERRATDGARHAARHSGPRMEPTNDARQRAAGRGTTGRHTQQD
jgi:hypothetical protein